MQKKYQVFVSSTYDDLKDERKFVSENLLKCNCIPVGMELFPSTNTTQWEFIKGLIDECDYYVLVLGGRYGSECEINEPYRDEFGFKRSRKVSRSFTHHEYHYAITQNIPIISFLFKDPEDLKASKVERTDHGRELYSAFRSVVENNNRMCSYWESPEDLALKVTFAINELINSHPMPGWIRALDSSTDNLLSQRLSSENEKLNRKVQRLELEIARGIGALSSIPVLNSPIDSQPTGKEFWKIRYSILQFRYRGNGFIQSSYSTNVDISKLKHIVEEKIRQVSSEGEIGILIKEYVFDTTLSTSNEAVPMFPLVGGTYRTGDIRHFSVHPEDIFLIQAWLKEKQIYTIDENGYIVSYPVNE
ncbi:DUF4062 domain-containing protein [Agarivorans sp. DSG3-1]|uniref:DUF4062 domain-containing protein n=1 Tax=Agarivorans sp. DSG3-1 TaxID=3342249 RepID=UPI00398F59D8